MHSLSNQSEDDIADNEATSCDAEEEKYIRTMQDAGLRLVPITSDDKKDTNYIRERLQRKNNIDAQEKRKACVRREISQGKEPTDDRHGITNQGAIQGAMKCDGHKYVAYVREDVVSKFRQVLTSHVFEKRYAVWYGNEAQFVKDDRNTIR